MLNTAGELATFNVEHLNIGLTKKKPPLREREEGAGLNGREDQRPA
jgi:hypothetical protein